MTEGMGIDVRKIVTFRKPMLVKKQVVCYSILSQDKNGSFVKSNGQIIQRSIYYVVRKPDQSRIAVFRIRFSRLV
ncbi:MAG: hypothetical protein IKQ10_09915, partial [Oscillospiraceae bacterium]|nr:hypothetical protein [Oscillospiraceae bacterium]